MIRRGRPGLMGTMARTAVVAGTATSVSNRMTRRANERALQEQQSDAYQQEMNAQRAAQSTAAPQVSAAGASAGAVQQLQELANMHSQGLLSDEEFAAAKAKLLAG
jgi:hypothetical protein